MLETQRQQLFSAYADIIPTVINTDVLPAGQRAAGVFCLGSLAPHQCQNVGAGRRRKSSVTKNTKRCQKSCLEGKERRRQNGDLGWKIPSSWQEFVMLPRLPCLTRMLEVILDFLIIINNRFEDDSNWALVGSKYTSVMSLIDYKRVFLIR